MWLAYLNMDTNRWKQLVWISPMKKACLLTLQKWKLPAETIRLYSDQIRRCGIQPQGRAEVCGVVGVFICALEC